MDNKKARILYIHNSEQIAGGNNVLLGLFTALNRSKYELLSLIPAPGPLEDELIKLAVPYVVMDVINPSIAGGSVKQAYAIIRFCTMALKKRISIIHAQGPLSYRIPSFIKKITNIKCICHLHFPVSQDSNLRWAFSNVPDILVACSNAVAEGYQKVLLDDLGILPKLEVVSNFVDTQRFKATKRPGKIRKELSIKESENVISIIGLVSQRKGHPDFLKMARLLLSELGASYFIVVGDDIVDNGNYLKEMMSLAEQMDIRDRVHFLGFRTDVIDIINDSDLVVLPSHEEGMPLSILEVGACSKPIVAYDIPGINEVVLDGVTGYLVEEGDINRLTSVAIKLLRNKELAKQFGANARKMVEEKFSLSLYTNKIKMIYDELFK